MREKKFRVPSFMSEVEAMLKLDSAMSRSITRIRTTARMRMVFCRLSEILVFFT